MLKNIFIVIFNFIKGIFRFLFFILVTFFTWFIHWISGERAEKGNITVRKARRIRFFTKIKIFLGKHLWLADFLGIKDYIVDVNKRLGYGV